MVAYLSYAGTLFTDRNGWKAGCTLLVSPSDLTSHTNWRYRDSNPGPLECEAGALPLELYKLELVISKDFTNDGVFADPGLSSLYDVFSPNSLPQFSKITTIFDSAKLIYLIYFDTAKHP